MEFEKAIITRKRDGKVWVSGFLKSYGQQIPDTYWETYDVENYADITGMKALIDGKLDEEILKLKKVA